ncbi:MULTISPECIES: hypothetical protein [Phyllobacterium]|jgi:hypothetical protein|uniref:Uncharacterized protein n=1 Tax=Phyllobacterium sophorae TaxID=1520277 RepID=A0A2P7BC64_9HYPH|nr:MULTISPECIES: hypothetical protein [Phyllobacterium]PSH64061.1 hypothetical protein CU103_13515 [Phyllobacterium sophorae]UXN63126.1 hypothetical protein N8E89_10650 [Phyllobacterium sp. A18/5-2]
MAKYFIIGETGEKELWLVDIDSRTVTPVTEASLKSSTGADSNLLQEINRARTTGTTTVKGINIAIAAGTRTGAKAQSYVVDD